MEAAFARTTLKSVGASLPERIVMIISSILKPKKSKTPVSKLDQTKLTSLAKTLLRYAVLVLAVETAGNLGKAIVKMQKSNFAIGTRKAVAVILTFTTASVSQFALQPFKVGVAVMCAISSLVRRSTVLQRWHLHPIYMFFVHAIHNYLMTHRIDWVDPEYVRLWSTVVPQIPEFARCTVKGSYPKSLVGEQALKRIPLKIWKYSRKSSIALALALSPAIVLNLCKGQFTQALKFVPKIAVSAFALALLPVALLGLPSVYGSLFGWTRKMHPALYSGVSALVSTAVFRIEKGSRLNVLQTYTEKVVLIALLRKFLFRACENDSVGAEGDRRSKSLERYFTSICVGLAAVLHM